MAEPRGTARRVESSKWRCRWRPKETSSIPTSRRRRSRNAAAISLFRRAGDRPASRRGDRAAGSRPPEDGGVEQHPIHNSDIEDLGPEDFEEMTDEVEKTGIKTDS